MIQHRRWPGLKEQRGLPLPPGKTYPPMLSDEELFDSPEEMWSLMKGFGVTEEEVRMGRASGLI